MAPLHILQLPLGPMQTNCYIVGDDTAHDAVVIDPGDEAQVVLDALAERQWTCRHVLLTHAHFDHIGAVADVVEATGAPLAVHPGELPLLLAVLGGLERPPGTIIVDGYVWLDAGDRPGLGAMLYRALAERVAVVGIAKTGFAGATASIPVVRGGSRRPLHVSAAGIDAGEAANGVRRMHGRHRIPTMLRLADSAARAALP